MFKHILVATDGSDASQHAVQLACSLSRMHQSLLSSVYVLDPYPYLGVGETNPYGFQAYMSAAQQQATDAMAKAGEICKKINPNITLATHVIEDTSVSTGIINTAKNTGIDLIVIGSHGRTGLKRLMLGSIATKVVAESPIPVLVTR